MKKSLIKRAVEEDGIPVIRHIGNDEVYRIKELIKTKVNGSWEWAAIYHGRSGKYCRMVNDFGNFEYLYNEISG
jgi:hypothetical protein